MKEPCEFVLSQGNYYDPPEYCPNDAEVWGWCLDHTPEEPDPDDLNDALRDYEWESDTE